MDVNTERNMMEIPADRAANIKKFEFEGNGPELVGKLEAMTDAEINNILTVNIEMKLNL